jgi:hypothetical protein
LWNGVSPSRFVKGHRRTLWHSALVTPRILSSSARVCTPLLLALAPRRISCSCWLGLTPARPTCVESFVVTVPPVCWPCFDFCSCLGAVGSTTETWLPTRSQWLWTRSPPSACFPSWLILRFASPSLVYCNGFIKTAKPCCALCTTCTCVRNNPCLGPATRTLKKERTSGMVAVCASLHTCPV